MNQEKLPSWARLAWGHLTRRGFIRSAAGAGAGLMLGSQIGARAWADDEKEEKEEGRRACPPVARPIPHISTPPGTHFFFPGPVDSNPVTSPNTGHDPSIITDFNGVIAQADLNLSGTGTDLNTGRSATYDFHTDMRFMSGVFVGLDNERHRGTIGFI
jgi:hypothetical protein